jgi:hypothetical protein
MNNGFFGFPTPIGISNNIIDIKEFESSGTYGVPPNAKRIYIYLVGAGAGGGGGARQTPTAGGGSGGMGGKLISYMWAVEELGFNIDAGTRGGFGSPTSAYQRLIITIGAGGNGGSGATTNSNDGSPGSPGGSSGVTISGTPIADAGILWAEGAAINGGTPSSGGTTGTSFSTSTSLVTILGFYSNSFLGQGVSGFAGTGSTVTVQNIQYNGGAGGGGYTGASAGSGGNITPINSTAASASGVMNSNYPRATALLSGGTPNNPGTDALGYTILHKYSNGFGGAGGGGSAGATAAGRGGNGYRGGGGGGGGGSLNGANGGDGGKGGNGYCLIIAYG